NTRSGRAPGRWSSSWVRAAADTSPPAAPDSSVTIHVEPPAACASPTALAASADRADAAAPDDPAVPAGAAAAGETVAAPSAPARVSAPTATSRRAVASFPMLFPQTFDSPAREPGPKVPTGMLNLGGLLRTSTDPGRNPACTIEVGEGAVRGSDRYSCAGACPGCV